MTKVPTDVFLAHYGVKGMKWGVRKDKAPSARRQRYDAILNAPSKSYQVTAKNGKTVTVIQEPNDKIAAFLGSLSKKGVQRNADLRENHPSFKFTVDGKHVGEASFSRGGRDGDDPTEINLTWLGVKKSERGNGYGSAVFDAAVQYGKTTGAKKLTLEVPGNSPDARHIYEKQGFKVTWEPTARQAKADSTWGGLTDMELDLTQPFLSHSALDDEDRFEKALAETFPSLTDEQEALVFGEVKHSDVDDFLAHYGVKGMKWGVRRNKDTQGGKRLTRKEVRALNKEGKRKFYQEKAERVFAEANKKGENVLVQVLTPGSTYPTIVTGREFVEYAARGGVFDVRMTDIYATRTNGAYELNENVNAKYQKVTR